MSNRSSKEQVMEYIRKCTHTMNLNQLADFTTIQISNTLNLSRSLASQYLNDLVKENIAVKISSRPVYYFDRKELEKKYHAEIKETEFLSLKEFLQTLQVNTVFQPDFNKAIGNEGSLNYCISQMKAAMLYPNRSLAIILYGEKGCGKTYLVDLMFEFCINQGLLKKQSVFVHYKVSSSEQKEAVMKELFGYYDAKRQLIHKGKLELTDGGVLYIQNVDKLSEDCQEKLAEFLKTGKFTRCGDDTFNVESSARIICSCIEEPQKSITQSLLLNVPIICHVPNWMNRSDDERRAFIIKFLKEEQENLDLPIYISENILMLLMNYEFERNIGELKKCIKTICANAFAQNRENDRISIELLHLPLPLLDRLKVDQNMKEDYPLQRVDLLDKNDSRDKIILMWEQLLMLFNNEKNDFKRYLEEGQKILRYYYDILVFHGGFQDARLSSIENIVLDILKTIKDHRNVILPINCGYVLTRMILSTQKNNSAFRQWENDHQEMIQECLRSMKEKMSNEAILSELILKQIQIHLHVRLSEMNEIFLMMNINMYNKDLHDQDTIGIILSHGYSTASSIADAANSLLSTFIFEAIDMPLNTPINEVSKKLNTFINANKYIKNIILLVDMGSLEEIGNVIADSVNVGVINNISTSLALNIGTKILQHYELEEILRIACEEAQCRYKVLSRAKREKAIAFTNDAGRIVSEKLCRLFKDSLPKEIDLKMIEYDYDELVKNGEHSGLFKKYDVVLMIKPYNLKIKNVNGVTLEEIMNFQDIEKVNQVLCEYLNEQEIEAFDQRLLKNFSMQSVMENLTILNAAKLLDDVSEAITALQHAMKRKFQSKTIVGIYIHICFLVERLVTKSALTNYDNLDDFIKEHQEFIADVNRSFDAMLTHYHVELPISEIACLYAYIENDNMKAGGEDEF